MPLSLNQMLPYDAEYSCSFDASHAALSLSIKVLLYEEFHFAIAYCARSRTRLRFQSAFLLDHALVLIGALYAAGLYFISPIYSSALFIEVAR